MRKECYLVEFKVYHYNSGAADNYHGKHKIECDAYDEAILIKNRVDSMRKGSIMRMLFGFVII